MTTSPLCIALDDTSVERIAELVEATEASAGAFKLGLTSFVAVGGTYVRDLARRHPVFLDLKFHDIPAQVGGAVEAVASLGIAYTTVHAAGGAAMVAAAAKTAPADLAVLAVTVLTSLDDADLEAIGIAGPTDKAVLRLAELALEAGADGLVCSPHEVADVRARFGPRSSGGPLLVVPGIRPDGGGGDDQRRTLGPRATVDAGADLIVVGRPITGAPDPGAAAEAIAAEVVA